MKLILSLTLIWTLSSTAEALQCLHAKDEISTSTYLETCGFDDARCITIHLQGFSVNEPDGVYQWTRSSCAPSPLCALYGETWSYRTGSDMVTVHCCNTDGCNKVFHHSKMQDANENGLQCFGCSDPLHNVCNMTIKCLGVQDRCINGTVIDGRAEGSTHPFTGCASASLCEAHQLQAAHVHDVNFASTLQCCRTSFCNSAWTAKLSVGPLLFGLIVHFSQQAQLKTCGRMWYVLVVYGFDDARCMTAHIQGFSVNEPEEVKQNTQSSCAVSSVCALHGQTLSYRTGFALLAVSFHCCNTDGCNEVFHHSKMQDANTNENGLQCFGCSDPLHNVCNMTIKCLGVQDRCINGTVVDGRAEGSTHLFTGCASASLCEAHQLQAAYVHDVNFASTLQCCGTSFCNSAWTAKLSVGPLLFGLIVHFVL
ncbi:uncharacterized protein [Pempheris klunzingeri]|uniref:uncharacterized protein n=1 Tax=Pempheris klunzingeri TaxID=3127111 RepID=UPI003980AE9B